MNNNCDCYIVVCASSRKHIKECSRSDVFEILIKLRATNYSKYVTKRQNLKYLIVCVWHSNLVLVLGCKALQ